MAENESIVICDAGPIIHLDELDSLNLLSDFTTVLIPNAVWQEVENHRPQAFQAVISNFSRISVEVTASEPVQALSKALALGAGEQEAIASAHQRKGTILLTDDAAARLAAESLQIIVHGMIGILLRAVRRKQRTPEEIVNILASLPNQSSLHIRSELLNNVIAQLKTEYGL